MLPAFSIKLKLLVVDRQNWSANATWKKWMIRISISRQPDKRMGRKQLVVMLLLHTAVRCRSRSFTACANGCTMTFTRPLHTHGFSLLQSGRIKRVSATTRRKTTEWAEADHAHAQFDPEECWPPAHVVVVAVGGRRRHRNEIDKTRHASDSRTSIIQCDRGRACVSHHNGQRSALTPCTASSPVAPRGCPISTMGLGAAQERH